MQDDVSQTVERRATNEVLDAIAVRLLHAEATRTPVPPVILEFPWLTLEHAYDVQLRIIARKRADGARIIGRKVGLTSRAMQEMLHVDQPDYGHLLETMAVPEGGSIERSTLIQPRVEPEIAFVIGQELRGPGITHSDVLAATRAIAPALEIIDSRIQDWRISLRDTIADNASSAMFVVGDKLVAVDGIDLREIEVVLQKNHETVGSGNGAAVLGHPLEAVAWLANKMSELGAGLQAADVVLPGSMTAAVSVAAGDTVTATFSQLGPVSVRFV